MSYATLNQGGAPSTPASGKGSAYMDSADGRWKVKRDDGHTDNLTESGVGENLLLNSGFWLAQRQTPGTLTTYSNTTGRAYGADRWGITNENASAQYQRIDTNGAPETSLTARFYGKFKKITSNGKLVMSQVIEGTDINAIRGATVRLQSKLKCTVIGSMNVRLGLLQLTAAGTVDTIPATFVSAFGSLGTDPTWGTNLSAITPSTVESTGTISGSAITCALTNSWQRFSGTFLIPTDCKNLVVVVFSNGQVGANEEINISEIGLYSGQEIMDWTPRPFVQVVSSCQRFYCKTFNQDTAPAQNAGVNTGEFRFMAGKAGALAVVSPTFFFPVPMRAAPATNTSYNPAAANAQVRDITAAADCTATAIAGATERGAYVTATGAAGSAVGNHVGVHLSFDAEL